MQTLQLQISGMTCGGCTNSVTKALNDVNGVDKVIVSLTAHQATVQYDEKLTSPEQLRLAVNEAGYGVDVSNTEQQPHGKGCCG